jgi:hypothetical protein
LFDDRGRIAGHRRKCNLGAGEHLLRGHEGAGSSEQIVEGDVVSVWFSRDAGLVARGEGRKQPCLRHQPAASSRSMNGLKGE